VSNLIYISSLCMKHISSYLLNFLPLHMQCGLLLGLMGFPIASFAQSFGPATSYFMGATSIPDGVAVGDVNGDGRPDIVTGDTFGYDVAVILGLAGGGFGPPTSYLVGSGPPSGNSPQPTPLRVAVGDVNGDGRPDIVSANANTNNVGVLLGLAGGGFAPVVAYSTGPGSGPDDVALADLNTDGRLDIVTANFNNATVGVLLGLVGGGFAPVSSYSPGRGSAPAALVLADMNGDGQLDVITANNGSNTVGLLLGQASGGFMPASTFSTGPNTNPRGVAVGDVNGDGRLDIVTANEWDSTISVLLGLVGGGFMTATKYASGSGTVPFGVGDVAVADVTGDGRLDIIATITFAPQVNGVSILAGQATGGFTTPTTYATHALVPGRASRPVGVRITDVNGDGRKDIITPNNYLATVAVLLNTSTALSATSIRPTAADVTLYPNPAHNGFSVLSRIGIVSAELLNSLGQVVTRIAVGTQASGTSLQIETAALPAGVYALRLQVEGALLVKRIALE
jgi:hypothetical protein